MAWADRKWRRRDWTYVRDVDDLWTKEGMRRVRGYWYKEQSDNLNPLRKFLRKNVGRPWDKVWSEICVWNKRNHVPGMHLRDHVRDYVDVKAYVGPDGKIHAGYYNSFSQYLNEFYVGPETGLLRTSRPCGSMWSICGHKHKQYR